MKKPVKSEYDFDVPVPPAKCAAGSGRAGKIQRMPVGASCFLPAKHSSNNVASLVTSTRKKHKMNLTCRRVVEDGVEGFRVWRLKDGEK